MKTKITLQNQVPVHPTMCLLIKFPVREKLTSLSAGRSEDGSDNLLPLHICDVPFRQASNFTREHEGRNIIYDHKR